MTALFVQKATHGLNASIGFTLTLAPTNRLVCSDNNKHCCPQNFRISGLALVRGVLLPELLILPLALDYGAMKKKLPPALPLQGNDLSEAIVRILNIIEGMLTQIIWWAQFKPILDEQILEKERLALAWVDQTVGEMTLIRTRIFDDFCSGKDGTPPKANDPKDRDLVLANFPGLNLGGGFFIGDQREKINQTIAHSTHKYLDHPEVPHDYKQILRAAIPKAKQFCEYVEFTLAGSVPERAEHARNVLTKLQWMEQFYVNVKAVAKPPPDAHFSI